MNTATSFTITLSHGLGSIRVNCPDEDSEMSVKITSGRSSKEICLSLEEAKELGKYMYDHAKYALKTNPPA